MTKQELNHHLALLQRLKKDRDLLAALDAAGLADEAACIRNDIVNLDAEVEQSAAAVTAWIGAIEDIPTRIIFRLRFLRGLEWKAVATLIGGGNTRSSVKTRAYRYMEAHHDK